MTRQRITVLSLSVIAVLLISAWMIYSAMITAKNTYQTGAPPADIKKALQPQTVALDQMHPTCQ
jgi:flagellar basal body-associated protein FliL